MAFTMANLRITRCIHNTTLNPSLLFKSYTPTRTPMVFPNRLTKQIFFYSSTTTTTTTTHHFSKKHLPTSDDTNDESPIIIYDGPLSGQLKRVKLFSLTTSAMGIMIQPKIIMQSMALDGSLIGGIAALGLVGFFTYVTPLLIHHLSKRYVTTMNFDPKTHTYTATTYTFLLQKREVSPNFQNQHSFKIENVSVPEIPGMFTTIHVKTNENKKPFPLFLSDTAFIDISHYGRLMGYDKPLDFHLGQLVDETITNKKKNQTTSNN